MSMSCMKMRCEYCFLFKFVKRAKPGDMGGYVVVDSQKMNDFCLGFHWRAKRFFFFCYSSSFHPDGKKSMSRQGSSHDEYEFIEKIGDGSFGQVYKARNKTTHQVVSLLC